MTMGRLSSRLSHIAGMVRPAGTLADVGCDHAYLPICLVRRGIVRRGIALDINPGPLARARENIARFGLSGSIETRLSDGFDGISRGEADAAIIAGLGGILTVGILSRGADAARGMRQIILEPQSELSMVRRYLRENGFYIEDEDLVLEDGKYYFMMRVSPERSPDAGAFADSARLPIEAADAYGPRLLETRHPLLMDYLDRERKLCEGIMDSLSGDSDRIASRREELQKQIEINCAASEYMRRRRP